MKKIIQYFLPLLIIAVGINIFNDPGSQFYLAVMLSIAFVYFLNLNTRHADYLIILSILFFLIPISYVFWKHADIIDPYYSRLIFNVVRVLAAVIYILRYWKKKNKLDVFELLKVFAVLLFCLYFWVTDQTMINLSVIMGIVYLATRFTSLENEPNKETKIVITTLVAISIFLILMARIQANEARKQTEAAYIAHEQATTLNQKLEDSHIDMQNNMNLYKMKIDSLQSLLNDCN